MAVSFILSSDIIRTGSLSAHSREPRAVACSPCPHHFTHGLAIRTALVRSDALLIGHCTPAMTAAELGVSVQCNARLHKGDKFYDERAMDRAVLRAIFGRLRPFRCVRVGVDGG